MKTIPGNLIHLAQAGEFDLIVHGCNCFCTMGAGGIKRKKLMVESGWLMGRRKKEHRTPNIEHRKEDLNEDRN